MYVLILGGIIIDQYVLVDAFPKRGQDTLILESFERVGGCAINVAQTIKNLGGTPLIVSQLGDDQRGREILQYMQTNGFSQDAIRVVDNEETGYCMTIVESSGERTFLTKKGCESAFGFEMINSKWFDKLSSLYLTGYYLLDSVDHQQILSLIQQLKDRAVTVLFDPGPLVDQVQPETLCSVIQLADILTPNTDELQKIQQRLQISGSIYDWWFNNGGRWLVEKKGSKGVDLWTKERERDHFSAYPVKSVDTSGAGDSFAGGLLYGLYQSGDIQQAIKIASACGAFTTTFLSPHATFTFQDIMKITGEIE